jgi:hypothetical protein
MSKVFIFSKYWSHRDLLIRLFDGKTVKKNLLILLFLSPDGANQTKSIWTPPLSLLVHNLLVIEFNLPISNMVWVWGEGVGGYHSFES